MKRNKQTTFRQPTSETLLGRTFIEYPICFEKLRPKIENHPDYDHSKDIYHQNYSIIYPVIHSFFKLYKYKGPYAWLYNEVLKGFAVIERRLEKRYKLEKYD